MRTEKLTRRQFVKQSALSTAGLCLAGAANHICIWPTAVDAYSEFRPNVFLHIASNDAITVWVTRCEMGQGVRTALPLMIAEELEVEPEKLLLRQASMSAEFAGVRLRTSGSSSSTGTWNTLRRAGATAREMLVSAASNQWRVDRKDCRAENGTVIEVRGDRRATYGSLAVAAAKLPVPTNAALKDSKDFRVVGRRHKRVDGPSIVNGQAVYGIDVRIPGMLYAAVARSPVFGGKPIRWDDTKAKRLPGFHDVVPINSGLAAGVAVTANSTWTALKARGLLDVKWTESPHKNFSTGAFYEELRQGLQRDGYFVRREGEAGARQAIADTLEAVYEWPYQAHMTMEPMNCTAHVKDGSCEIWVPTQAPEEAQQRAAQLLGIPPSHVRVNITLLGGGFGRRLYTDYVVEAVELSRKVGAPVHLVWSREDDTKYGYFNPPSFSRVIAGLNRSRRPVTWFHRVASSDLSIYPQDSSDPMRYAKDGLPWGAFDNPYRFSAIHVDYIPLDSPVPTGPWRSVFYPGPVFAREGFLDELAIRTGIDPIQLRLDLLEPGDTFALGGDKIDRARLMGVLRLVAEKSNWSKPLPQTGDRRWGRGVACNVYAAETYIAHVAEVSVGHAGDVRVHRVVCALDLGQPLNVLGIEGQVESGVLWGLTSTLKSTMEFRGGQAQSSNYADYEVLRFDETPVIETHIVPSTLHPCGLGEQPVPPVAPAVVNAVFAATGKRLRRLPIRLSDLL